MAMTSVEGSADFIFSRVSGSSDTKGKLSMINFSSGMGAFIQIQGDVAGIGVLDDAGNIAFNHFQYGQKGNNDLGLSGRA